MSMRDYWRVLVRRKWLVLVPPLLAVVAALGTALLQEPIYESEAQMLVELNTTDSVFQSSAAPTPQVMERAIATQIRVIEGEVVRARVAANLGLQTLPPAVDVTALGSTDVVALRVRSTDATSAQVLADAYIDAYINTRREQGVESLSAATTELTNRVTDLQVQIDAIAVEMQGASAAEQSLLAANQQSLQAQQLAFRQRLDQLQVDSALSTGGATVVRSADLPSDPVEPQPLRTATLAAVIGLLIGLAAAVLADYLDDSMRTESDVALVTELPILAVVPIGDTHGAGPIALLDPGGVAVESYRGLRTNLQFLAVERPLKVLQVTSSLAGEGKTTTATNLAAVLAQAGHDVLLVDADLRRPRVHEVFGLAQDQGLTDVLLGNIGTADVGARVTDHLFVLPSGKVPPNPSELLSSVRTSDAIRAFAGRFDYVVIDSAPILPVADSLALAQCADGVVVVAQAQRTPRRGLQETLGRLARVSAPVVGVLLNKADSSRSAYGYGYGAGYAARPQPDRPVDGSVDAPIRERT